jgi:hypothetical protein
LRLAPSSTLEPAGEAHNAAAGFFKARLGRGQRDAQMTGAPGSKGVAREQRHIPTKSPQAVEKGLCLFEIGGV